MKLEDADSVAHSVVEKLRPYCDRIEIAGSVRRRKPDVGDIEIVCIPQRVERTDVLQLRTDEGGGRVVNREMMRNPEWTKVVRSLGYWPTGDPDTGKYVKVEITYMRTRERVGGGELYSGEICLDIFTAHARNWGLIYAIRTGSAAYSHKVLACGWCANGYHSAAGMLARDGVEVPTFEEVDLFNLAGVPWCEPQYREVAQ